MDRPQIIKIKKSDFEAALAAGELEEIGEDQSEADTLTTDPISETLETDDPSPEEMNPEGKRTKNNALNTAEAKCDDGIEDDDVSRLMSAIEEELGASDAGSTRQTYNQLRAAAAETDPEALEKEDAAAEQKFRNDLADVIRPRRPSADRSRELAERPAPLKLVAEQRVDQNATPVQQGPVRPRRVAAEDPEETAETTDEDAPFAEYVSEKNAVAVPDLLEAAAAYLVFVEGRDQFSRPQVMNKVRQVDAVAFDREEGLRSFGQLLRVGKIEKAGGGRFTATADIGFRPDERATG